MLRNYVTEFRAAVLYSKLNKGNNSFEISERMVQSNGKKHNEGQL